MRIFKWLSLKKISSLCVIWVDEVFLMNDNDLRWLIRNSNEKSQAVVAAKYVLNMRNQNGLSVRDAALFNHGRNLQDAS
jgi:hypothetical protein